MPEKIANLLEKIQTVLGTMLSSVKTPKSERAEKVLDQLIKTFVFLQIVAQEESKTEFQNFYQQNIMAVEDLKKRVEKSTGALY